MSAVAVHDDPVGATRDGDLVSADAPAITQDVLGLVDILADGSPGSWVDRWAALSGHTLLALGITQLVVSLRQAGATISSPAGRTSRRALELVDALESGGLDTWVPLWSSADNHTLLTLALTRLAVGSR